MAEPTDHLATLRRQRALVAAHLAWLDSELARHTPSDPPPTTPPPTHSPAPAHPASPHDSAALANARADQILARHAVEDRFDPARTRRGCILLFAAALALGFALLSAIYYFGYQPHP